MGMVVDARGLDCPQPVILTNKAFDEVDELTTIVDNEVARENVTKLARTKGFSVKIEEKEGDYYLYLTRESCGMQVDAGQPVSGPTVLLIASDGMGRGSDEGTHASSPKALRLKTTAVGEPVAGALRRRRKP
jgi:TusA-related sulfurtransferase